MKKIRVGFVSDTLYPYMKGGVETLRYVEMHGLSGYYDIYSFSMLFDGMKRRFMKGGIHHIAFGRTSQKRFYRHGRRSITNAIKFAALLPLYLFRYRFDVLEVNAFPYLHIPAVKLYCAATGCKFVLSVSEVWDRGYWKGYLGALGLLGFAADMFEKWTLNMADSYITISSATTRKLERIGVERKKIHEFSPVLDIAWMQRSAPPAKRNMTVVFAGRMIKEKRVDRWLDVFKAASRLAPGLSGVLVGEGPEEGRIREAIARKGLEKSVEFRPFYKTKRELYRLIRGSSLLLNMSEREGLSIIALEGIALGTPVVLPSYTPIPPEVKGMCVVGGMKELPGIVAKIAKSGDKGAFIKNVENLDMFSTANTPIFYKKLFKSLGL